MINLVKTNSENIDFINLIKKLDKNLHEINGEEQLLFNDFNKIDMIRHVIVAYENNLPIGCGAIKKYSEDTMEVKRIFVSSENRGKGIASQILNELTIWSKELGYTRCILETGVKQLSAIALYKKNSFEVISNYGEYENIENSICFEKFL